MRALYICKSAIHIHTRASSSKSEKFRQKSPTYPIKSPIYPHEGPIYLQTRRTHPHKSLAPQSEEFPQKSPLYPHRTKSFLESSGCRIRPHKSTTYLQKSLLYPQKSPTNPKKRPIHPHKSLAYVEFVHGQPENIDPGSLIFLFKIKKNVISEFIITKKNTVQKGINGTNRCMRGRKSTTK